MENASLKIVKRGEVYLMTLVAGENRFNHTMLDHLDQAFDFLEKYEIRTAYTSTLWLQLNITVMSRQYIGAGCPLS